MWTMAKCGYPCSKNGILKILEILFMLVAFGFVIDVVVGVLETTHCSEVRKGLYGYKCVPNEYSVFVVLTFIVAVNALLVFILRTLSDKRMLIRFELVCCFFEVSFVIMAVVILTSRIIQYGHIAGREIMGVVVAFISFPLFLFDAHFAYKELSNSWYGN